MAQLYLRNLALLWVFAGGWHWLLYQRKAMGSVQKYDPKWQAEGSSKFLFNDQGRTPRATPAPTLPRPPCAARA